MISSLSKKLIYDKKCIIWLVFFLIDLVILVLYPDRKRYDTVKHVELSWGILTKDSDSAFRHIHKIHWNVLCERGMSWFEAYICIGQMNDRF